MGDARRRRVLCVDDNHDVADTAAELLGLVGFDAVACYDGAHALAAAPAFRPDVCVIDLNMPVMDGDELAVRLRELFSGTGVVLVAVTARGDADARQRTTAAGFAYHLLKPVDPTALVSAVGELTQTLSAAPSGGEPPDATSAAEPPFVWRCQVCRRRESFGASAMRSYLDDGWPVCCGTAALFLLRDQEHPRS